MDSVSYLVAGVFLSLFGLVGLVIGLIGLVRLLKRMGCVDESPRHGRRMVIAHKPLYDNAGIDLLILLFGSGMLYVAIELLKEIAQEL